MALTSLMLVAQEAAGLYPAQSSVAWLWLRHEAAAGRKGSARMGSVWRTWLWATRVCMRSHIWWCHNGCHMASCHMMWWRRQGRQSRHIDRRQVGCTYAGNLATGYIRYMLWQHVLRPILNHWLATVLAKGPWGSFWDLEGWSVRDTVHRQTCNAWQVEGSTQAVGASSPLWPRCR